MDKSEFVKMCQSLGYCTKKEALKYAESKELFTEEDFYEVYHIHDRNIALQNRNDGTVPYDNCGGRTTKRYTVYNSHEGGSW